MKIDLSDRTGPVASRRSGPRMGWWIVLLVLASASYLAYPYYCLHRIDRSLQSGIERDLALYVGEGFERSVREELGKRFILDMLTAVMDEDGAEQTPDAVLRNFLSPPREDSPEESGEGMALDIRYAFFETPTVFRVDLGAPGSPREDWVTVRLRLEEWVWKLSEFHPPK